VGARGLGGFRGLLLGSVSQTCLHYTPAPLVIVRNGDAAGSRAGAERRIVVGVDGSEPAHRALEWAICEARRRGVDIEALHVWRMPTYGVDLSLARAVDPGLFEAVGLSTLSDAVKAVDASGLKRPVEQGLVVGHAASALLDAADDAEMLVVGNRGRGGFASLVLGSVSHHVAHHATRPVVVMPART
jgi:nucleotide-binding universal stress UspA family protein